MKRVILRATLVLLAHFVGNAAIAETVRISTPQDGQIRFNVSVDGPTRLSVAGDRISKVLQTESSFEMVNDEGTGDVFLRYAGGPAEQEAGYIVTESGVTVGFIMTPKDGIEMQTVLITITGRNSGRGNAGAGGFAVNSTLGAAATTPVAAEIPKSRTERLVDFVRLVHARRIADRSAASRSLGVRGRYSNGGLRARISVVAAPGGTAPDPASFYNQSRSVLAVWVDDNVTNGKVWVITVEGTL
ncbi:type-F conjugative transfer system secretin TraK [Yoonia sp. SS1-5]|uniref:Type-F conjugative transfer system secretin TraK n=1 Tax=Yoonia rhodophyticola TaxID=3137370 RepID=A0AAN0MAK6_9RHOB